MKATVIPRDSTKNRTRDRVATESVNWRLPERLEIATDTPAAPMKILKERISTGSASCHKPRRILLKQCGRGVELLEREHTS